jgi:hypothetical protein
MSEVLLYNTRARPPHGCLTDKKHLALTRPYLTESVHKVVLQKSIPAQIRQLIICHYQNEEYVDEFVREMTSTKRLCKRFV